MGYQEEDFEGQQYILEEGEYPHCSDWGGSEDGFLSLRPLCTVSPTSNIHLQDPCSILLKSFVIKSDCCGVSARRTTSVDSK